MFTFTNRLKFLFTNNLRDLKPKGYQKVSAQRFRISRETKDLVFKRDNQICFFCEQKAIKPTIDHFVPYSVTFNNELKNLKTACWGCNNAKGNINPLDPAQKEKYDIFIKQAKLGKYRGKTKLLKKDISDIKQLKQRKERYALQQEEDKLLNKVISREEFFQNIGKVIVKSNQQFTFQQKIRDQFKKDKQLWKQVNNNGRISKVFLTKVSL